MIFAHWLFILKTFHFNSTFALACISPQAFVVVVARFQEYKSPNQS